MCVGTVGHEGQGGRGKVDQVMAQGEGSSGGGTIGEVEGLYLGRQMGLERLGEETGWGWGKMVVQVFGWVGG
jgi:hypothetical protein